MTRSRDIADQQDNLGGAVAPFVAGKNKIINGDMAINQRNFVSSSVQVNTYMMDRFFYTSGGSSPATFSIEQFPVGTVLGNTSPKQYLRVVTAGQSGADVNTIVRQIIEDVSLLAGQTVTISFWARAASGTPKIALSGDQQFGTGGSPSARVRNYIAQVNLSTNWERKSVTYTVPSISGKTLGTNPNTSFWSFFLYFSAGSNEDTFNGSLGIQSNTFDVWGLQIELGNVATPFTPAGGGFPGAELALCQRYYYRHTQTVAYERFAFGQAVNTNSVSALMPLKATMRTNPSAIEYSGLTAYDQITQSSAATAVTLTIASPQQPEFNISGVGAGLTQFRAYEVISAGTSGSYIAFSAEL